VTRTPDWQAQLDAFIGEHRADPFRYGEWDCCLFVCGAIHAMTGVDPGEGYRGAYSSREEARRLGFLVPRIVATVCAAYGMERTPVPFARRGDVALVRRSLGIVALNGSEVLLISKAGLSNIPISLASRAWHV
jgi:hypothetical protein